MLNRKQVLVVVIVLVTIITSVLFCLYIWHPQTSSRSLLIYKNYLSDDEVTNWIIDMETGEKWEVGKGFESTGWSPSGKYIAFHTLTLQPFEIWISDSIGNDLHQVLDIRNYPDLKVTDYAWLTDETILVNVVADTHQYGYMLNVNTHTIEKIPNSTGFIRISPDGKFWVEFNTVDGYSLVDMDAASSHLSSVTTVWSYYFSPNGHDVAYSCAGTYRYSSLCLANISMSGIANEHEIANDALLHAWDLMWSQDGQYLGFFVVIDGTQSFRAINMSSGRIAYEWAYPSKTVLRKWSPRGDKVIDYDGLILDLETGTSSNLFQDGSAPYGVIDWRLVKTP